MMLLRFARADRLTLLLMVMLAGLLSMAGVPVTSAQGTTLFAARLDTPLPVEDPFDPTWDQIRPLEVALSGQAVVPPMRLQPAVNSVRVRALVNDDQLAIQVEWPDPTVDDSVLAVDRFADAVAVQFALGAGTSICMGQQAGGLNIWHWKADWAADLAGRRDVEDVNPAMPNDVHVPSNDALTNDGFLAGRDAGNLRSAATVASSVEDLNAVGFGSLTAQPLAGQNVHGASQYRAGVWRVVMSRQLLGDPNDATLSVGGPATAVAFAVWDGARGDRDGQKSVSTWLALAVSPRPTGLLDAWPFFIMVLLVIAMSGLLLFVGARQPAIGLGGPGRPSATADGD